MKGNKPAARPSTDSAILALIAKLDEKIDDIKELNSEMKTQGDEIKEKLIKVENAINPKRIDDLEEKAYSAMALGERNQCKIVDLVNKEEKMEDKIDEIRAELTRMNKNNENLKKEL